MIFSANVADEIGPRCQCQSNSPSQSMSFSLWSTVASNFSWCGRAGSAALRFEVVRARRTA